MEPTKARDVMTTEVVAVRPDMPAGEIARLLLERRISAVPVIDSDGALIGMVSEGDLAGRSAAERETRADWWLKLAAGGEAPDEQVLEALHSRERTARDAMSSPVVTVDEDADIAEIARLLANRRIKRVPVLHQGRVVGIVSRADLLRPLASAAAVPASAAQAGLVARVAASLDARFRHHERPASPPPAAPQDEPEIAADAFQKLVQEHKQEELQQRREQRETAAEHSEQEAEALSRQHLSDEAWHGLLRQARDAAERGQTEFLMLRFPSQLCSDGGRAINVPEPIWPATLRGEAAEVYLRWEQEIKAQGFDLIARVLDYPDGMPGDIGLFLVWGGQEKD